MLNALPYAGVLALSISGLVAIVRRSPQRTAPRHCETASLAAMLAAAGSLIVLLSAGAGTSPVLGIGAFGFSSRIDAVSVIMALLVSFVGWTVLRYAWTYLDGEPGAAQFSGWMSLTIAAVLLLVQAGNLLQLVLAWIATSLFLHHLLRFYPARRQARRAAHHKFVMARIGDGALLLAALLLAGASDTGDIAAILFQARGGELPGFVAGAGGLIAVAAALKSAQFPTHGWLTEVMETPTPVSALLHAGLINAGGFLLIRFADVMLLAPGALLVLAVVGGLTALTASLVMLTQAAVKTKLAWSTIAQMGFMILQCGLGLFALALLHIVAHSVYKAHAFLASGNAVEVVTAGRRTAGGPAPGWLAVLSGLLLALATCLVVGLAFGLADKSPQAIMAGGILVYGVFLLVAPGLAARSPAASTLRTVCWAMLVTVSYFTLQGGAHALLSSALPQPPRPGPAEWTLMVALLGAFGAAAFAQATLPHWVARPAAKRFRVHLSNGFYAKAIFDRLLGDGASGPGYPAGPGASR